MGVPEPFVSPCQVYAPSEAPHRIIFFLRTCRWFISNQDLPAVNFPIRVADDIWQIGRIIRPLLIFAWRVLNRLANEVAKGAASTSLPSNFF